MPDQPRILGEAAHDAAGAWRALARWRSISRVVWLDEPADVDDLLNRWNGRLDLRVEHWTDAYLAAVATASGSRLVTFDVDF